MSGLLERTNPELAKRIAARRQPAAEPERPAPKPRWLQLAAERENGLARDLTGRPS